MGRILTDEQAQHVRDMLAEGRTRREVADLIGTSKETVNAIAENRWRLRRGLPRCSPGGIKYRCPGCGGLVEMPCLLCKARNAKPADLGTLGPPLSGHLDQKGDEVCSNCGQGEPVTSGRGIICSNCDSGWHSSPSLAQIVDRTRQELRGRTDLI